MPDGPSLDSIFPPISPEDLRFMDEDLARIQEITGRGEGHAMVGGVFLICWGCVMAVNAFYYNVLAAGWLPHWAPQGLGIIPILVGVIISVVIARLRFRDRLFISWRSRSISFAWMFGMAAIFTFMFGSRLSGEASPVSAVAFTAIIFSMITAVMASADRRRWLLWPAGGWMACGFVTFFLRDGNWRAAVFGICSLVFMSIPGLILAHRDRHKTE